MRNVHKAWVFLFGGLLLVGNPAVAGDSYWGSAGGSFNTAGSWESGGVPGAGDTAWFTNNAVYTVTFAAPATTANATFDAPGGIVTVNPGNYAWTLGGTLDVGPTASAETKVQLDGGTYSMSSLVLTNVTESGNGKSFVEFKKGTLNTSGGVEIHMATNGIAANEADFTVGLNGGSGNTFTWNITGGTNKIYVAGPLGEGANAFHIGMFNQSGKGVVNLSGAGTVLTNNNWVQIGRATWNNSGNELNIRDGAKMYTAGTAYIGWTSGNNHVLVDGTGSLWRVYGSVVVSKNANTGGNSLIITNGATVNSASAGIQEADKAPAGLGGKLIVTGPGSTLAVEGTIGISAGGGGQNALMSVENGGAATFGANLQIGHGTTPGTNNWVVVTGQASSLSVGGSTYIRGTNCGIVVREGGVGTLLGNVALSTGSTILRVEGSNSVITLPGQSYMYDGAIIMATNGGKFVTSTGGWAFPSGTGRVDVVVSGSGSSWSNIVSGNPFLRLGNANNSRGVIRVENGGWFLDNETNSTWGIQLGYSVGSTGEVAVTGIGSVFEYKYPAGLGKAIYVGNSGVGILTVTNRGMFLMNGNQGMEVGNAATASGSTVSVTDGGILDFGGGNLTVGNYADNSVSNSGGVFQFAAANPTITPGTFGKITINGGTVSFRGITDGNVLCSQAGKALAADTKVAWSSLNTFRLNAATNAASGQAYTFTGALGAANFSRLELINGAMWRGGIATIGSGGTLVAGLGTNRVTDVTFTSDGTLDVTFNGPDNLSYLIASGAMDLGGASLSVTLGAIPERDVLYPIIGTSGAGSLSGRLANRSFTASYHGIDYEMSARAGAGGVNLVWATAGSVIVVR